MREGVRIVFVSLVLEIVCACSRQEPQTQRQAASETEGRAPSTTFATPEEAAAALVAAIEKQDADALTNVLGPGAEKIVASGDEVADRAARDVFLTHFRERHDLVAGGPNDVVLQVGHDRWPLPIPLVHDGGRWRFDSEQGAEELLVRRIGANELNTIDVLRGYVDAQEEYASTGHDGAPAGVYAQRLRSDEGKQNGLYWLASANEPQSPAGPLLAAAAAEGYGASGERQPYHGYLFRTVHAQGEAASGGARAYVQNGVQRGGFALIAYPSNYGASGVMTFMVNQDGVIWQRDLGADTASTAATLRDFNPDDRWTPLAPQTEIEVSMR